MTAGRVALAAAAAAALALVAAASAVAHRRQVEADLSPWPSAANAGPRGLAVAAAWLAATGRPAPVLSRPEDRPAAGAVLVLAAPRGALSPEHAEEVAAHAAAGGTVVWAVGPSPQPALERRLGPVRASAGSDLGARTAVALAPHPLFDGLALRTSGGDVASDAPGAVRAAGGRDFTAAVAFPVGRGEVVLLAGSDALENRHLAEAGNLSLWARLAARGPIALDERHLHAGASLPAAGTALAPLVLQALLAGAAFVLARGRRLGAVRPPPPPRGRTAREYLKALGALYRRARAEGELARSAWGRARRELE
ncbi:MAG TPA: DUF4350 domain-containing protein, partial [Anaeromyxobacteraceae bacterium]|nr:DUF4350 domain-containing protein [Anaeromyxobacteraceae bacterium]